jgi:peptidoglycan/xylan/chitin deacetylase (PgdA/CDA1 family)
MTEDLVEKLCGIKMALFAPPSGAFNKRTVGIANSLGYKTILWTHDTIDWRDQDENLIYNRATKDASAGDLILCHPTECTANTLERIIIKYKELGFKINTVSSNIL